MTRFTPLFFLCLALTRPCLALDARRCVAAHSAVEAAVCANSKTKSDDDAMSRVFFDLYGHQDEPGKERELKDQRRWLKERERICSKVSDTRICVSRMASERQQILVNRLAAQSDLTSGPLYLGGHEIRFDRVLDKDGETSLVAQENGAMVMSVPSIDVNSSRDSGAVVKRHTFGSIESIVIEVDVGGTLRCREAHALWHDPSGTFKFIDLGEKCSAIATEGPIEVRSDGFVSITTATPTSVGVETTWRVDASSLLSKRTPFAPTPGTTMQSFSSKVEPLTNAEFYKAVTTQTGSHNTRFLRALWGEVNDAYPLVGDETNGMGEIEADDHQVYVAGCGQKFNGSIVECSADNFAMTFYDRVEKRFYFAVRAIGFSSTHVDASLKTYPMLSEWSAGAKERLISFTHKYEMFVRGTTLPEPECREQPTSGEPRSFGGRRSALSEHPVGLDVQDLRETASLMI